MNTATNLRDAEIAIAGLSISQKNRLLKKLAGELNGKFAGIEKTANVMGGAACVGRTRIPVWMLEQARRQGVREADLLLNYPVLTAQDLSNAWDYADANAAEIENDIAETEAED